MLTPTTDLQLAYELCTRIESVYGSCASAWKRSKGNWSIASSCESPAIPTDDIAFDFQNFDARSELPLVLRSNGKLLVAINTCVDALEPIVVVVSLPDQEERLICSLLTAHLEALRNRVTATTASKQSEFFIDQVTQDFEELTWLRTTNEYFDLCDSRHTIESIASSCFPTLVNVIRAEAILLVRSADGCVSETGTPDWNRVVSTGDWGNKLPAFSRLVADSIDHFSRGPIVRNCKLADKHFPNYPGIRNYVALAVAKGQHVYGWILAINKLPSSNAQPFLETEFEGINPLQFGTFEAGLLSAAANIMASHARNVELFQAQESLLTGVVRAIINAIDAKDPYTFGHSDRVARYAKRIAAKMGLGADECERIYMSGLLHDVGKIGVPDSILAKPGPLSADEYTIVKKHPEIGYTILKHLKQLEYVLPGVLHHHEAVNGQGYPCGLVGEAIPLHGRILAVADAYDAMTSDRPYRPGIPSEKAESILRNESGKIWDSDIVGIFLDCLVNDDAEPHHGEVVLNSSADTLAPSPNNTLMRRISNAINSLVVE